jgi:hypothetical protein
METRAGRLERAVSLRIVAEGSSIDTVEEVSGGAGTEIDGESEDEKERRRP